MYGTLTVSCHLIFLILKSGDVKMGSIQYECTLIVSVLAITFFQLLIGILCYFKLFDLLLNDQ